ncbi:hypothetical protein [Flavobacterium sp.]|uniref:hypothetical protein n=1 Tax=Flavobacterium sp. TaxID=239 RepID=UPI00261A0EEC|nr:hypothetical protein [Flavobacterium sp.]
MNRKKAIEILQKQKQKLDNPNFLKDENWVFQTASYIKDFFGESSTEYFFISKFEFTAYYSKPDSKQDAIGRLNAKTPKAKKYLENCIETISNKGLYKHPKKNLVSDKSNFELIGIVITISIFVFWIGYWVKSVELFSSKNKTENSTSFLSNTVSQKITNPKEKSM